MPIYEYFCAACGQRFEMLQKLSSEPMKKCIYCGSAVKKLVSSSSFQLKGSGFYNNDYKRKSGDSESTKESVAAVKKSDAVSGKQ